MNMIALDTTIRCRHGRALVGGFTDTVPVQHDGTGAVPGDSLACDDEKAKAAKREQAAAILRREAAWRAGRYSTHAAPMTAKGTTVRSAAYHRQNGAVRLTPRQLRRMEKKYRRTAA